MSKHHGKPPQRETGQPGKPASSSGISPELAQLRSKIETVEKTLQEYTVEKNQWNAEVRGWLNKKVSIHLTSGTLLTGELRWIDRYTFCVFGWVPGASHHQERNIVVHKGAVALMYEEEGKVTGTA